MMPSWLCSSVLVFWAVLLSTSTVSCSPANADAKRSPIEVVVPSGLIIDQATGRGEGDEAVAEGGLTTSNVLQKIQQIESTTSSAEANDGNHQTTAKSTTHESDNNIIPTYAAKGSTSQEYHGTRGSSAIRRRHRQTRDVEDMLQDISSKDPEEWTASEWLIMIVFLYFILQLGCCLLSLCCCGRGGGSNLLGCLCLWELCCRGGEDIDNCCDYNIHNRFG